jgi:hypothetical protein
MIKAASPPLPSKPEIKSAPSAPDPDRDDWIPF